jgi:hypothetical protein
MTLCLEADVSSLINMDKAVLEQAKHNTENVRPSINTSKQHWEDSLKRFLQPRVGPPTYMGRSWCPLESAEFNPSSASFHGNNRVNDQSLTLPLSAPSTSRIGEP